MIRRGIWTREQYAAQKAVDRRRAGGSVAFNLLLTSSPPTPQEILDFEDISFTLRMGNGTFRTTFRHRFDDLNATINEVLLGRFPQSMPLRVEDRAVSHGLTSWEWALALREKFPAVEVRASDLLLFLVELRLPDGTIFIAEPNGQALQYIKPPYAVSLSDPEIWRYPSIAGLLTAPANALLRSNSRQAGSMEDVPIPPDAFPTSTRKPSLFPRLERRFHF